MVTSEQISKFSDEQRDAWMASLTEDESVILRAPPGHRYTLAAISEVKWFLAQKIPDDYRLRFLEFLERHADLFSVAAIAQLEPMPDEGREIIREARKLGKGKWLDVVARWEVFGALVAINPSLLAALRLPEPARYTREIGPPALGVEQWMAGGPCPAGGYDGPGNG
jgi:hypothetical protein